MATPCHQHGRRVGSVRDDADMTTIESDRNNASDDASEASPADRRATLHAEIEELSDSKTRRACRALVSIEQTHLSYYQ